MPQPAKFFDLVVYSFPIQFIEVVVLTHIGLENLNCLQILSSISLKLMKPRHIRGFLALGSHIIYLEERTKKYKGPLIVSPGL